MAASKHICSSRSSTPLLSCQYACSTPAAPCSSAATFIVGLQQETRQLLVQVIAADEAAARAAAAPVALKEYEEIDTGDEAEPDGIEQWQRREAARIRCVISCAILLMIGSQHVCLHMNCGVQLYCSSCGLGCCEWRSR
jgi:hypothetical protein